MQSRGSFWGAIATLANAVRLSGSCEFTAAEMRHSPRGVASDRIEHPMWRLMAAWRRPTGPELFHEQAFENALHALDGIHSLPHMRGLP